MSSTLQFRCQQRLRPLLVLQRARAISDPVVTPFGTTPHWLERPTGTASSHMFAPPLERYALLQQRVSLPGALQRYGHGTGSLKGSYVATLAPAWPPLNRRASALFPEVHVDWAPQQTMMREGGKRKSAQPNRSSRAMDALCHGASLRPHWHHGRELSLTMLQPCMAFDGCDHMGPAHWYQGAMNCRGSQPAKSPL